MLESETLAIRNSHGASGVFLFQAGEMDVS